MILYITGYAVQGTLTRDLVVKINRSVARSTKLTMFGFHSATWEYGLPDMWTTYQPLKESGIVVENWPEKGGGFYIVISCKPCDPDLVYCALQKHGLKVVDHLDSCLRLQIGD